MIDIYHPKTLQRLRDSMDQSNRKLKPYRENAKAYLKQYVGTHYGPAGEGSPDKVPLNLIEKTASVFNWKLAASAPKVLITTESESLLPLAADAEVVLNRSFEKMNLDRELRRWVNASLFGLGVLKVGWEQTGVYPIDGEDYPVGEAFVKLVSKWDFIVEMGGKDLEMPAYIGHKYRMLLSEAKENPHFNEAERKKLKATPLSDRGTDYGERDARTIGAGTAHDPEEFQDHVELWELYFPRYQITCTLPIKDGGPLLVEDWRGPEGGPYHFLYYNEVADNVMPLPPAASWIDMHDLVNMLYRKLGRQAENQKTNLMFQKGFGEDAKRVAEASDLDTVEVADVNTLKEVNWNGPNQTNLAFMLQALSDANNIMGNPDLLAGSAAQSPTATQDELLQEGAGGRLQHMQDRVYACTKRVIEHLAWYYWHDPLRSYQGVREIPNTEFRLEFEITPEMRENNFAHFNFNLEPYSMQRQSPQQRLSQIMRIAMEVLPMYMQQMEMQGKYFDAGVLLDLMAKYANLPELKQLVKDSGMIPEEGPIGKPERGRQSPVTHRNYTRESRAGGPTGPARSVAMMQSLLNGAGGEGAMVGA